jgi:hypothetical protein
MPAVYDLGQPKPGGQNIIFWLMNGSLLVDVASCVALLTTGNSSLVSYWNFPTA